MKLISNFKMNNKKDVNMSNYLMKNFIKNKINK